MLVGTIGLLVPIAIIGGIVALIVSLVRRRRGAAERGARALRHFFTYGLALAALVAAATGATLLLSAVLDSLFRPTIVTVDNDILALGLALTIVSAPIWLLFWLAAQRSARADPTEAQSTGRKVYLSTWMAASAVTAAIGAIQVLQWLLGAREFTGTPPALLAVWGAVWAFHWQVDRGDGPATGDAAVVRRLYRYGLSLFGLAVLAIGADTVLRLALTSAYDALFGARDPLLDRSSLWSEAMRTGLAMTVVGGVWWAGHWLWMASGDRSVPRQVYLYLFAVFGGAVAVVTAATIGLYHVLQWSFGTPEATSARAHFDVLPDLIAAAVVGAAAWVYHWTVIREEARGTEVGLNAARRVYGYLVAAVGLVVLGAGLTVLIATLAGMAAPRPSFVTLDWRDQVILAVTLLVVGAPVWGGYWYDVQRRTVGVGLRERAALSRRVFIFLVFGASVLLTLVNLSIILYRVFDALIGGDAGNILWEVRWSVGMVLTAGAVSGYYWLVLSEDRRETAVAGVPAAPVEAAAQKAVTVLIDAADQPLARRLEEALGYEVEVWERLADGQRAPALTEEELAAVGRSVREAPSSEVMVLVDRAGVHVVPYRPGQV